MITLPLVLAIGLLTGACAAPLAVAGASYAADGGLLVASNKTSTDHVISMVSKKDCAVWRAFKGRNVCQPREGDKDPYNVDYTSPERQVSEDGVRYVAPLRPAADAPAESWNAADYRTAPPPVAAPSAPMQAAVDAPSAASPAATAKPVTVTQKKPKARSAAKKPARRPAVPAS